VSEFEYKLELTASEVEALLGFIGERLDARDLGDSARADLDGVYAKLVNQLEV
jgi:hypothetical protein